MKHAYLIIAHSEYPILQILLSMLDEYGNDVYLQRQSSSSGIKIIQNGQSGILYTRKSH